MPNGDGESEKSDQGGAEDGDDGEGQAKRLKKVEEQSSNSDGRQMTQQQNAMAPAAFAARPAAEWT